VRPGAARQYGRSEIHIGRVDQQIPSGLTVRSFHGGSAFFGPDSFAFPRQESSILDEEGFAAAVVDTTNLDTPYRTNIVRRKDLVAMRLPHHYAELVKWHP
jgi:hypothetical protein